MILSEQTRGEGPVIVILHGLFGSGDNWQAVARSLSSRHRVTTMDLRNHGNSGHASSMHYREMAEDVLETMDALGIEATTLIGHSMGGKVAMMAAIQAPARVNTLVVVDIAPRAYPPHHKAILSGMQRLEATGAGSRAEADAALSVQIDNAAVRAFLLKSARPGEDGLYRWTLNLQAIAAAYDTIAGWPEPTGEYRGPALMVCGSQSDYVTDNDYERAHRWFPSIELTRIADSGHWVHADQRDRFCGTVISFLNKGR